MIKRFNKRAGFELTTSQLIGFAIAIFILVIFLIFYLWGWDWLKDAIDWGKNFVRFGGGRSGGGSAGGDF